MFFGVVFIKILEFLDAKLAGIKGILTEFGQLFRGSKGQKKKMNETALQISNPPPTLSHSNGKVVFGHAPKKISYLQLIRPGRLNQKKYVISHSLLHHRISKRKGYQKKNKIKKTLLIDLIHGHLVSVKSII